MNRTAQFRWMMTMLALVAALVVAGTALGGVSQEAGPLGEPRVEPRVGPLVDPLPTDTPDPYAPPPTATSDPSITPSATPTASTTPYPLGSVYGVVEDTSGAPVAGAQITFTRLGGHGWEYAFLGQTATGADGRFWFPWDCSMATVRLELDPPAGFQGVSAELAPGEYGMVWNAYRMDFAGEFVLKTSGPFKYTIEPIPPTPDLPPGVTPTWTRSAYNEDPVGLPGCMWISHAATQVGQCAEVGFYSTAWVGASATIHFDPTKVIAVDAQGNPTNRAVSYWPGADVHYDTVDNVNGIIRVKVVNHSMDGRPLATYRFRALQAGTAVLDIVDGTQENTGAPMTWGNFGADDGLIQIAPAPTATATPTCTPTPTLGSRMVHGTVLDPSGAPVPNAALTLYRYSNTAWTQKAAGTSGADGVFRLWTNPIPGDWKLFVAPPAGYAASSAALPDGVSGQVVSADTLTFALGGETGQIGAFRFVVAPGPTATPTPSPQPTLPPVVLQGRVTWNGVGLAGVQVTLSPGGLASVQTTVTDDEGYYSFVVDGGGEYVVSIHDPEGRVEDASRVVDTDAWEPGPIDWGQWEGWLPWVSMTK